MATVQMTLDVWAEPNGRVFAVQGEADARFLEVTFVSGGVPVDLTGKTVSLYMVKPDGNEIFNACTLEDGAGGRVTAELTAQMSAAAGRAKDVEFRITGGEAGTDTLKVKGPAIVFLPSDYDGAIASTPEYTALTQALAEVSDFETVKALAQGAIPASEKGAANGVATLDSSGKLSQMPAAADVGAIPASEKGAANGVAALDSSGKLAQMPSPSDIGAIAVNQKGVGGGVASLNGIGKLEQMPTPADLGIVSYITEWNGNTNGFYVKLSNGYMVCYGKASVTASFSRIGATDLMAADATVNYPAAFSGTPTVMFTTSSSGYVSSCLGGQYEDRFQARFTAPNTAIPSGLVVHYIAIGQYS